MRFGLGNLFARTFRADVAELAAGSEAALVFANASALATVRLFAEDVGAHPVATGLALAAAVPTGATVTVVRIYVDAAAVTAEVTGSALESTIISHGFPYPANVECALQTEQVIRDAGAVPALGSTSSAASVSLATSTSTSGTTL